MESLMAVAREFGLWAALAIGVLVATGRLVLYVLQDSRERENRLHAVLDTTDARYTAVIDRQHGIMEQQAQALVEHSTGFQQVLTGMERLTETVCDLKDEVKHLQRRES